MLRDESRASRELNVRYLCFGTSISEAQRKSASRPSCSLHWTSATREACVVAMSRFELDQINQAFAELTGCLEDAAGLAAEGQASGVKASTLRELQDQIAPKLRCCCSLLDRISALLAEVD